MKNMYLLLITHINSHMHAAKHAKANGLSSYMHARNAYMRDHAQTLTDGTSPRAFEGGPKGVLP